MLKSKRFTISTEEDMYRQLIELAEQNRVSISWIVRYALANLFKEREIGRHQQLVLPFKNQSN